jgi:hypothetical protein
VSGDLEETKSKQGKGRRRCGYGVEGEAAVFGLRLKEEETKSRGGAAGWFVSVNGSGAAGFEERKSKPGGGRLIGLDRFRVRFFFFFLLKLPPSFMCVEDQYL